MSHPSNTRFTHQRLDAYRVAVELFAGVESLCSSFPAGHADLRDQLRRSAGSVVRNIAEGANRVHARDKAARFGIALGECGECEASLEMVQVLNLGSAAAIRRLRLLADRVAAMLCGLIRRQRARARGSSSCA